MTAKKAEVTYVTDSEGRSHEVLDLTIEKGTVQYIVDAKFMEMFASHFTLESLDQLKIRLTSLIQDAHDAVQIFEHLEEELYLYRVINHPNMRDITVSVDTMRREAAIERRTGYCE